MFDLNVIPWWGWLLIGAITWFFINNFGLPDAWSTWLGQRRNGPVALLPLGIIALVLGVGNLTVALGWAIIQALGMTSVSPWVWWLTVAGVAIVVLFCLTWRWHNFRLPRRPQQVQQAQPQQNP